MRGEPLISIVGAGGLGVSCAWAICRAWHVGSISASNPGALTIRVIDGDRIDLSNLHRQVLFPESAIGEPKATVLAAELARMFAPATDASPAEYSLRYESHIERIDPSNIDRLLQDSALVIDATDSIPAKLLLNDYAVTRSIPFCYGAAVQRQGQLLYRPPVAGAACLRCLFGDLTAEEAATQAVRCHDAGIMGPVVGFIGALQGAIACEVLNDKPEPEKHSASRLIRCSFDTPVPSLQATAIAPAPDCPLGCAQNDRRMLDLTGERCPATFLYTKLALEQLTPGSLLEVRISDKDSADRVWKSATEEGFNPISGPRELVSKTFSLFFAGSPQTNRGQKII